MKEIWKDIPGYEGIYQASSEGNIRSLDRYSKPHNNNGTICQNFIRGKFLKGSYDSDGYLEVQLTDANGCPKYYRMHRLVALTFIPNPDNTKYTQVDHINCVKDDNRVCNLEWVTCKENINRAWNNDRCTPRKPDAAQIKRFSNLGKKSVLWQGHPCRCIEENKYFISVEHAARYYKVNSVTLRDWIIKGRKNTHQTKCIGLNFEYISKDCKEYKEMLLEFLNDIDN